MDEFGLQLLYSINDDIRINNLSYLNNMNEVMVLRNMEKKFSKYGYIKPYSLKCISKTDYSTFSVNQFTSRMKKEYICKGLVHYPKSSDIYKGKINMIQKNCGIRCSINDIFNKKTGEEVTILSVIIPITSVEPDDYNINDIVYIQILDVRYENNVKELFAIGNIISEDDILRLQNLKPKINDIMKNYLDETFIVNNELLNRIEIMNNHLNIIYPVKYSNNKLVYSIYEFLMNIEEEDNLEELYIKYIYKKYNIFIVKDKIIDLDYNYEVIDNKLESETGTLDDDFETLSEKHSDEDDDEEIYYESNYEEIDDEDNIIDDEDNIIDDIDIKDVEDEDKEDSDDDLEDILKNDLIDDNLDEDILDDDLEDELDDIILKKCDI
jgi:hypothetical protein